MIVDIINKKRLGSILSRSELEFIFQGYLQGKVTDYQMSSLLMAICIRGMTDKEIFDLTDIFLHSGEQLDFSDISGVKVDKHSTGGVGDKTTMIIAPIVASLGVPVVKMSGRGLGFTGGTIDKLESIPGFRTDLSDKEIRKQVREIDLVVTGQTANLVPLDKKIYALRNVTGTVESIPLIATSIMSKKIASGADKILIDIKVGKGALLKTKKDATRLSRLMVRIGKHYKREVRCMITDMNAPLGTSVGNSLEVMEAVDILKGNEKNHLTQLCIDLASEMVSMGLGISFEKAKEKVIETIENGEAYGKFLEFVNYQGGDLSKLSVSDQTISLKSTKKGIIKSINAFKVGKFCVSLGAGRVEKEDTIDPSVGIKLQKFVGDQVEKGEVLCTIYAPFNIPIDQIITAFDIS